MPENASGGSSSSSSLLIRSKNPRRCQAENPLKLLSEFAGPALVVILAEPRSRVAVRLQNGADRAFLDRDDRVVTRETRCDFADHPIADRVMVASGDQRC